MSRYGRNGAWGKLKQTGNKRQEQKASHKRVVRKNLQNRPFDQQQETIREEGKEERKSRREEGREG